MRIIAFDTASEIALIAVFWQGVTRSRTLAGYARHSEHLLPALADLLAEMGILHWQKELDAVAFAAGPGAFTGVRLACSVAQGLAMALGKPVVPLDSLALIGRSAFPDLRNDRVWVAADARMGEWYLRGFAVDGGGDWQPISEPLLVAASGGAPEPLMDETPRPFRVARFRTPTNWPAHWSAPTEDRLIDALTVEALLAAACSAVARGEWVAAEEAHPHYVRDRVALTLEEQRALRAGKKSLTATS
ncbi:hypothetical protein JCM16106_11720 [Hydrogenophilus islandicus]